MLIEAEPFFVVSSKQKGRDLRRDKGVSQTKECDWCFCIKYRGKFNKVLAVETGRAVLSAQPLF